MLLVSKRSISSAIFHLFTAMDLENWRQRQIVALHRGAGGNSLGCVLWAGGPYSGECVYGQKRWQPPGAKSRVEYTHRIAYMLSRGVYDLPGKDEQVDVSHICHTPRCILANHLVLEAHTINMERRACEMAKKCSGQHEPQCLF